MTALAAHQVDALVQAAQIICVAGDCYSVDHAGDEDDRSVDGVRCRCSRAQLSCSSRACSVKRMDLHPLGGDDSHEAHLPGRISPRLSQGARRHVDVLRKLQKPDHTPVGSFDCDESASVEDYRPRTLRAHAVSSSVAGPRLERISLRTSASFSRCALSVIAEATHALSDGARPAATAASAARTASSSTVTVTRVRIRQTYYCSRS